MLRQLHKYLIYYNFFIALCSFALTYYFATIFDSHPPVYYYIFDFCATLVTYNFLRHYRKVTLFLKDTRSTLFWIMMLGIVICLICFVAFPVIVKLYYLPLMLLVLLYSVPFFKRGTLRGVPFVKIFVIAVVWVLSACSVIFFSPGAGDITAKKLAFIIAQIFFFIAITIPFDIKDVIYDTIKTIPNTLGEERSMALSRLCLAVYITLILVFGTNPAFKFAHVMFSLLALYVISRQKDIRQLYKMYYFVDGLILAQTGFILVFGHLFLK